MVNTPKPTNLKILQGNPGKRKVNRNEPQPDSTMPDAPDHLDEVGKAEWDRVSVELHRIGLLTGVDRTSLAAYCQNYSRWVKAEQMLQKNGFITKAESGYEMPSPWVAIGNKALDQMRKFLVEFGMTPASRTKVKVEPPKTQSAMAALLEDVG